MTIEQTFQIALQHQYAGRLPQAEKLYRQILAQQPDHVNALLHLGVLSHQVGRNDAAADLIRQAIALKPDYAQAYSNLGLVLKKMDQLEPAIAAYRQSIALNPNYEGAHYNLGIALKDNGQLNEAIAAYRQAILLKPQFPEAYNNLGIALRDNGQLHEVIDAYRQAIALKSNYPEAHYNLGIALGENGELDESIAAYRHAISLNPNYPQALTNLGNALKEMGQLDEAIAAHRRALAIQPHYADAQYNLGIALLDKGQLNEAIAAYRQAIVLKPNDPDAYSNLANALRQNGQPNEAVAAARKAIALNPNRVEAYNNLGTALGDTGHLDEAVVAFGQAISLRPRYPQAHYNLGTILTRQGKLDHAIAAYRRALAINPRYAKAYNNLGVAMKDLGKLDEAIAALRQAISISHSSAETYSNLLLIMLYHPDYDSRAIAEEQSRWNRRHAEPLKHFILPHLNDRNPDRCLKIGYFSADFRIHASAYFLIPLLENHDPRQIQFFCYAQLSRSDEMTRRLQQRAAGWYNTVGISDAQVAQQIRQDQIDILVDLKLHTSDNRLLVFARKPAPVQVAWLGYPGSTGLQTIDYRLTDPYLDPSGTDESVYAEQTVRLPETFWCYDPLDYTDIPINPLPAQTSGFITFGCLNNFCKINSNSLALWAKLLHQVKNSRLLMLTNPSSHVEQTADTFRQHGIDPLRLEFIPRRFPRDYLQLFHRVDISLDTLPYNGHTTSLDSLWMGVPFITLPGRTAVGRAGVSILSNVGLPELIAHSQEQYIQLATELAHDLPRLSNLRSTLRQRMEQSPLMDAPRFARNIEAAYRLMWHKWCASS